MSSKRDNRMVWNQQRRGHFEAWSTSIHDRPSGTSFSIHQRIDIPRSASDPARCTVQLIAFDSQDPRRTTAIASVYPIDQLRHQPAPFRLHLGPTHLEPPRLHGSIEGVTPATADAPPRRQRASWDLRFSPSPFTHHPLPRHGNLTGLGAVVPHPIALFDGEICVADRRYRIDAQHGAQSHQWGRHRPHVWASGRCASFREDSTAALEVLSLKLARHGIASPALTFLSLYCGSEVYHFREPWTLPLTRGEWGSGTYRFRAIGHRVSVTGKLRCDPTHLVLHADRDTDGRPIYLHQCAVADATVVVCTRRSLRAPFRHCFKLTSRTGADLEYGAPLPEREVQQRLVEMRPDGGCSSVGSDLSEPARKVIPPTIMRDD